MRKPPQPVHSLPTANISYTPPRGTQHLGPRTAPNKKPNCTALNSPTTKDNLRRLLAENLEKIPEESADWPALLQVSEALGQTRKRQQDWFDCNSAEIQSLLKTKHKAYKALLSCP